MTKLNVFSTKFQPSGVAGMSFGDKGQNMDGSWCQYIEKTELMNINQCTQTLQDNLLSPVILLVNIHEP